MARIDIIFDDQTVVGTDEDDDISAGFFTFDPPGTTRGQNDTIFALGGADNIRPGDGNDSVFGGSGDDFVFGGEINDGNDALFGGTGSDELLAGGGSDTLAVEVGLADFGEDTFSGGSGFDRITFQTANIIEVNGQPSSAVIQDAARGVSVNLVNAFRPGVVGDFVLTADSSGEDVFAFVTNERGRILDNAGGGFADVEEFRLTNFSDFFLDSSVGHSILGGGGNDFISGGGGGDHIDGGEGVDTALYRSSGAGVSVVLLDLGSGGTGSGGDAASDKLFDIENVHGSDFGDFLLGDANANALRGFAGKDTLLGGSGRDTVSGGEGDDLVRGGVGDDSVSGGGGVDTALFLDWNGFSAPIGTILSATIALAESGETSEAVVHSTRLGLLGRPTTTVLERDMLSDVENVTGSDVGETITGNSVANVLDGRGGKDLIDGGQGHDTLIGGTGVDTASYFSTGAGVAVNLGITAAQNTIGAGTDTIREIENLRGSRFDDTLTDNGGNNVLDGREGRDALRSGLGDDTLIGGDGLDTADYSATTSQVTVDLAAQAASGTEIGNDALSLIENARGGAGDDELRGSAGANVLTGGAGKDRLAGGADADVFDFSALGDFGFAARRDVIEDFGATDTIDLQDVDASSVVGGNQAFQFIGSEQFSGVAGQLRAVTNNAGNTIVAADTDGNGSGDIQIQLNGVNALTGADFIF